MFVLAWMLQELLVFDGFNYKAIGNTSGVSGMWRGQSKIVGRRNFKTWASQQVVQLWKATLTSELQKWYPVVEIKSLIRESSGPHGNKYICRKYFFAYKKVLKAKAVVNSNARLWMSLSQLVRLCQLAHSACPQAVIRLRFSSHLQRDFHHRLSSLPILQNCILLVLL